MSEPSGTTASTETSNVAMLHSLRTNNTSAPNVEPTRETTVAMSQNQQNQDLSPPVPPPLVARTSRSGSPGLPQTRKSVLSDGNNVEVLLEDQQSNSIESKKDSGERLQTAIMIEEDREEATQDVGGSGLSPLHTIAKGAFSLKQTTSEKSDNDNRAMTKSGTPASTETSNVAMLQSSTASPNGTSAPNAEPTRETTGTMTQNQDLSPPVPPPFVARTSRSGSPGLPHTRKAVLSVGNNVEVLVEDQPSNGVTSDGRKDPGRRRRTADNDAAPVATPGPVRMAAISSTGVSTKSMSSITFQEDPKNSIESKKKSGERLQTAIMIEEDREEATQDIGGSGLSPLHTIAKNAFSLKQTTSEESDNDDRATTKSGTTAFTETSNVAMLHSVTTNDTGSRKSPAEPTLLLFAFVVIVGYYGFVGFFLSLVLMLPWLPLRLNAVFPVQALKRFLLQPLNKFLLMPIKRFLRSILLPFFGLLQGKSARDEFSVGENDMWKNWMGRIHHLEKNVTDMVDGSEDRVKASFHKAVEDSENNVKASVDSRLATIESSFKVSVDALQASVDASLQASVDALETRLDVTLKEIILRLDKMEKK